MKYKKDNSYIATESLVKKYYDYNETKFNLFSIEQALSNKRKKYYYYISGMVATFILIFAVMFSYHFKNINHDMQIAYYEEVIIENDILLASYDETQNYLTVIEEIEDNISSINDDLYFNYEEYIAFLNY